MSRESTAAEKPLEQSRATPASAAGVPYRVDISSSPIREDPNFKKLAQQVSKDPSLFEKEEELVLSAPFVLTSLERAETTHFDYHIEIVHQVRKNPHFTKELCDLLEKDLTLSSVIASYKEEVLQALIENHSHDAVKRYRKLLKEWGETLGFALVVFLIKNDEDAEPEFKMKEMEEIVYRTSGIDDLQDLEMKLADRYERGSYEYLNRFRKITDAHVLRFGCEDARHRRYHAIVKAVWHNDKLVCITSKVTLSDESK